ncbi:MAG TPA: hypothetical protein PK777_04820 [Thermoguttaceae bacterium]|nr:hypothetical protein [Thermoguttaceae bacterium]HPP52253.1 hypothetical protein [Thermoguttaceae bacterium]
MWQMLRRIPAVVKLEFRPRLLLGGLGRAAVLGLLPVFLVWSMQQVADFRDSADFQEAILLFILMPGLLCILCQLFWASPIVQAGMEENIWSVVGVRPYGKTAFLLGKYLMAVCWTIVAGWGSSLLCAWIIPFPNWRQTVAVFAALVALSAFAYGAIFLFLGALFIRRGMVAAVAYVVFIEALTGTLPALIHHLTVQYHLRSLLFQWVDLPRRDSIQMAVRWLQEEIPWWAHLAALAIYTVVMLTLAVIVVNRKELVKPEEN